ncbi:MAG: hypothetical protein Q9168_008161 [Polycauliona sp. 1 TL-2023]
MTHPNVTAIVTRFRHSDGKKMDEPLLPPKGSATSKIGSAADIAHMDHGKSSESSPTDKVFSSLPSSSEKPAKTSQRPTFDQKLKDAAHKPATWGILIASLVLIIAVVLLIRKLKQRKQQRINDDKTKMMMRWHMDRGLV